MKKIIRFCIITVGSFIFASHAYSESFKTIDWIDLLPKDDFDALMNPPAYLNLIEDGSFEDKISGIIQNSFESDIDDRYQQALASTTIIEAMNNQNIRIPGFIVPLLQDDSDLITEFFLVPYFGACIHLPPPPPNQIIYIEYEKGLTLDNLYDPWWISGQLKTTLVENELATSAYTMQAEALEIYREE